MRTPETEIVKLTERSGHSDELLQLVSFNLDSEEYGLEILRVQEIIRMQGLTRVPNSPAFVVWSDQSPRQSHPGDCPAQALRPSCARE